MGLLSAAGICPVVLKVVCPDVESMTPFFLPVGTKGQVEWEEVFGLSGGRWDDSNDTMIWKEEEKQAKPRVTNLMGKGYKWGGDS